MKNDLATIELRRSSGYYHCTPLELQIQLAKYVSVRHYTDAKLAELLTDRTGCAFDGWTTVELLIAFADIEPTVLEDSPSERQRRLADALSTLENAMSEGASYESGLDAVCETHGEVTMRLLDAEQDEMTRQADERLLRSAQ